MLGSAAIIALIMRPLGPEIGTPVRILSTETPVLPSGLAVLHEQPRCERLDTTYVHKPMSPAQIRLRARGWRIRPKRPGLVQSASFEGTWRPSMALHWALSLEPDVPIAPATDAATLDGIGFGGLEQL